MCLSQRERRDGKGIKCVQYLLEYTEATFFLYAIVCTRMYAQVYIRVCSIAQLILTSSSFFLSPELRIMKTLNCH